ncbi:helix-turn-helix transcriptional regulator [Agrobacterium sp. 22-209-1]
MTDNKIIDPKNPPQRFLTTKEAAFVVGICKRTLEKHRTYGTGPKYRKVGGRVLYDIDDLRAWTEIGARVSTTDPISDFVRPAKQHAALAPRYAGKR